MGRAASAAPRTLHGAFVDLLIRRRRWVVAAFALAFVVSLVGMRGFRIDPDVAAFYPRADDELTLMKRAFRDQSPTRLLIVVLRGESGDALAAAAPFAAEALAASPLVASVAATRADWFGERSKWIARAPLAFLSDDARLRLLDRLVGPGRRNALLASKRRLAEDPAAGAEVVMRDPLDVRWIFDAAASEQLAEFPAKLRTDTPYVVFERPAIAMLRATGVKEWTDLDFADAIVADAQQRLDAALRGVGVRAELAGGYVSASFQSRRIRDDANLQAGLAFALASGFLVLLTRSVGAAALILVPIVVANVATLALGSALLGAMTPLGVTVTASLVAQGPDFPIHFRSAYRQARATTGPQEALAQAHASVLAPMLGGAATTIVAFLAFLASGFPGIRQFGVMLALGILVCLVTSLTLYPALVLATDRGPPREEPPRLPVVVRWIERIHASRMRVPAAVAVGALGVAAWAFTACRGLDVDLDPRNCAPPGDRGDEVLGRLEADLGVSVTPVHVLLPRDTPIERIRAGVDALRRRGTIAWSDGPQAFVPSPTARSGAERFRQETRGWTEAALAEMASVGFRAAKFEKPLADLRDALEREPPRVEDLSSPEFAGLRDTVMIEASGRDRWSVQLFNAGRILDARDRAAFDAAVREELGQDVRILSSYHIADHFSGLLRDDLHALVGWSALGVAIATALSVGRVFASAVAMIPLLVAFGCVVALCTLTAGAVNLFNVVALPIVIGVGTDDGIYFVSRRLRGGTAADAIRKTGPGIWGAAATTVLGFAAILPSITPGLVSMALLVAAGRIVAFASALLLLPALPTAFPRRAAAEGAS